MFASLLPLLQWRPDHRCNPPLPWAQATGGGRSHGEGVQAVEAFGVPGSEGECQQQWAGAVGVSSVAGAAGVNIAGVLSGQRAAECRAGSDRGGAARIGAAYGARHGRRRRGAKGAWRARWARGEGRGGGRGRRPGRQLARPGRGSREPGHPGQAQRQEGGPLPRPAMADVSARERWPSVCGKGRFLCACRSCRWRHR